MDNFVFTVGLIFDLCNHTQYSESMFFYLCYFILFFKLMNEIVYIYTDEEGCSNNIFRLQFIINLCLNTPMQMMVSYSIKMYTLTSADFDLC